jgi:hypothetical protein
MITAWQWRERRGLPLRFFACGAATMENGINRKLFSIIKLHFSNAMSGNREVQSLQGFQEGDSGQVF